MSSSIQRSASILLFAAAAAVATAAYGQPKPPAPKPAPTAPPSAKPPAAPPSAAPPAPTPSDPDEAKKVEARRYFGAGVAHVDKFQWAEALVQFEKSYELVQHPNTSLNIGVSERALGRYVAARRSFERALVEHDKMGGGLSKESLEEAKAKLAETQTVIVRAKVTIRPADASITVDGRPIVAMEDKKTYAAGLAPPGRGEPVPSETFDLILDPGNHVFVLSKKGFTDRVVNRDLSGGADSKELVFELAKLNARIVVSSKVEAAIVRVGKMDVGPVPVEVSRPAGVYPVVVQKEGFVPYETSLSVQPGEEAKIDAVLKKKTLNVAEQWWFWTSIAGALGTAAVVTYFVVRPEPEPPPYNGGTTDWVVKSHVIRF